MVQELLAPHFDNVSTSTHEDKQLSDFDHHPPNVLVLAFDTLDKAQRYSPGLYTARTAELHGPGRAISGITAFGVVMVQSKLPLAGSSPDTG